MIGIVGLVVFIDVTTGAGVRSRVVIPVMTVGALVGDGQVSSLEYVIIVMNGEAGRGPPGIGCVTSRAFVGDRQAHMIGIGSLVIIVLMASFTGIGCIVVSIGMALCTIAGDGCMCPG